MNQNIVVNTAVQAKVVNNLCNRFKAFYVFPDIADQICIIVGKHLEDGDYATVTGAEAFAALLTSHIREVSHDGHLIVKWHKEPIPEQNGSLGQNAEWMEDWFQKAKPDNFGIYKVERFPGNVGYIDIREFHFPDWGGDTVVAAMNFVTNTNALIIDLRQCRGGDPGMVSFISTYLFGNERVHLNSLYLREGDITEQYWTLPYVPGKRYVEKPVYILISSSTFSGAEEFAYNLKNRQRAILVGETTGGGANIGAPFRLHPHFDVFIPIGRSINPITGTNWEGIGVNPDVPVAREQAFHTAYLLAIKSIIMDSKSQKALVDEAHSALIEVDS